MVQITLHALFTVVAAHALSTHEAHPYEHAKRAAPVGKAFDHLLQIWYENKDYNTIASTTDFDKMQSKGILLTNFNAAAGDTLGVTDDGVYHLSADKTSIFDLLEKKGLTWKLYQEDIPSVGYTGAKIWLELINFNAKTVPNWMFFTPNLKNDRHDTTAAYAGKWLSNFVSSTLYSNPDFYKNTLFLISFDEVKKERNVEEKDTISMLDYSTLNTAELNWGLGNLGRQDTNKLMFNVFSYAAGSIPRNN